LDLQVGLAHLGGLVVEQLRPLYRLLLLAQLVGLALLAVAAARLELLLAAALLLQLVLEELEYTQVELELLV